MSKLRVSVPQLTTPFVVLALLAPAVAGQKPSELKPVVEAEEDVYSYQPADNGSGPMWCHGSTCLVRIGDDVFASGLETLKNAKPLNNVRWLLLKREADGWKLQQADPKDRTREPCPLAGFPDGRLFMSVNPTLVTDPEKHAGPSRPEILQFSAADPRAPFQTLLPKWNGEPKFTEHSYRSFAGDGPNGELIIMQNIGYTHSEWAFRDRDGKWIAHGKLVWPKREDPRFSPYNSTHSRVNYPNVVLKNRSLHYCGASAINKWERVQDNPELMGRKWGSRFRRLFYTWTPDITTGKFSDWIEIDSTHKTGGWLFAGDVWVAPDGRAHILWTEYPIHRRLRDLHFPDIKRTQTLKYAVIREGKIVLRRTLVEGGEGLSGEIPDRGRFQVSPDNRLVVFHYVSGTDASGKTVSENRVMEILPDGSTTPPVRVPLASPFSTFFTATPRAGSPPSNTLDVLGSRVSSPRTISYTRIRLW